MDDRLKRYEPIFGSWYFGAEIGSGAYGKVYRIYRDEYGKRYESALKIITFAPSDNDLREHFGRAATLSESRDYVARFRTRLINEVDILNRLKGAANIVAFEDHRIYEWTDRPGLDVFIRMELLTPLDYYFETRHATRRDVLKMWRDIANALALCESQKIIHRDIKPSNILVSPNTGTYKLTDFGISRQMEDMQEASTQAGSWPYMAPEVQRKNKYNSTVDIYSLGLVIYRYFNVNRHPFTPPYPYAMSAEDRDQAIRRRFAGDKIPPIPGLPKRIFDVIAKSVAYEPSRRYRTAQELIKAIDALLDLPGLDKPIVFPKVEDIISGPPPKTKVRADKKIPIIAISAGAVAVGMALFLLLGRTPPPPAPGEPSYVSAPDLNGVYVMQSLTNAESVVLSATVDGVPVDNLVKYNYPGEDVFLGDTKLPNPGYYLLIEPPSQPEPGRTHRLQVSASGAGADTRIVDREFHWRQGADGELSIAWGASAATPAPTVEPTPTPTVEPTPSPEPTSTPTVEPTPTSEPTSTPTVEPTPTPDPTPTPTVEPTPTFEPTPTMDPTPTPEPTPTPTVKPTPTPTPEIPSLPTEPISMSLDTPPNSGGYIGALNGPLTLVGQAEGRREIEVLVNDAAATLTVPVSGEWRYEIPEDMISQNQTTTLTARYSEAADIFDTVSFIYDAYCEPITINEEISADITEITGLTEAGADVELSINGEPAGSVHTQDGPFGFAGLTLDEGDEVLITAVDPAGNESTLTLTAAAGAKTAIKLLMEPAPDDAGYIDGTLEAIIISGIAKPKSSITVALNGQPVASTTAADNGSYGAELEAASIPADQLTVLTVYYTDGEGAEFTQERTFTYDPACALSVDAGGLSDETNELRGSSEPEALVRLYLNGELIDTAKVTGTGFAFENLLLTEGDEVRIEAVDPAGNRAEWRGGVSSAAREQVSISSAAGINGEGYLPGGVDAIKLAGTAEPGKKLALSINGATLLEGEGASGGDWSAEIPASVLIPGEVLIEVHYADGRGEGDSLSFIYDPECEPVSLAAPLDEDSIAIEGHTEPSALVELSVDGESFGALVSDSLNGSFVFDTGNFPAGTDIHLAATDIAGNTAELSASVGVSVRQSIDVSLSPAPNEAGYIGHPDSDLEMLFTARPNTELAIDFGGQYLDVTTGEDGSATLTIDFFSIEQDLPITVTASYADGISPGSAASLTFIFDDVCEPPLIDSEIEEGDNTITGSSEPGARIVVELDDSAVGVVAAEDGSFWALLSRELIEGETVIITATDLAGNSEMSTYTVARKLPTVMGEIENPRPGESVSLSNGQLSLTGWVLYSGEVTIEGEYIDGGGELHELDLGENDLPAMRSKSLASQLEKHSDVVKATDGYSIQKRIDISSLSTGELIISLYARLPGETDRIFLSETVITLTAAEAPEVTLPPSDDEIFEFVRADKQYAIGIDIPSDVQPGDQVVFTGWFAGDRHSFFTLDLEIDGELYSKKDITGLGGSVTLINTSRPVKDGVAAALPDIEIDIANAGFIAEYDLSFLPEGPHQLQLVVTTTTEAVELDRTRFSVQSINISPDARRQNLEATISGWSAEAGIVEMEE